MKPLPREHGTDRGYQQHRHRSDMPACQPCLAAHVRASVENKRRRRAENVRRCVECGKPVEPGRRSFCGTECCRLGRNRRERERGARRRAPGGDRAPQQVTQPKTGVRWVKDGLVWRAQKVAA